MNEMQSAIDRSIRGRLDPAAGAVCVGKVCHASMADALKEAKAMKKKFGRRYNGYECRFCGAFHVGRA